MIRILSIILLFIDLCVIHATIRIPKAAFSLLSTDKYGNIHLPISCDIAHSILDLPEGKLQSIEYQADELFQSSSVVSVITAATHQSSLSVTVIVKALQSVNIAQVEVTTSRYGSFDAVVSCEDCDCFLTSTSPEMNKFSVGTQAFSVSQENIITHYWKNQTSQLRCSISAFPNPFTSPPTPPINTLCDPCSSLVVSNKSTLSCENGPNILFDSMRGTDGILRFFYRCDTPKAEMYGFDPINFSPFILCSPNSLTCRPNPSYEYYNRCYQVDCFAGTELVETETGERVPIQDISAGDRVKIVTAAGEIRFSEVLFVPHEKNFVPSEFIRLTTSSGLQLKVTRDHLVSGGECGSPCTFNCPAHRVEDIMNMKDTEFCLSTLKGRDKVIEATIVHDHGAYTVVPMDVGSFLVVNDIIASPFAFSHFLGHMYYNLHRIWYLMSPQSLVDFTPAMRSFANTIFGGFIHPIMR
mmetsp:Transcript_23991/g.35211  ORF Transcript_23991/g.35211 Transcript_23991/m.35211 type:complete len:468 (-) Transcript_23991:256-1659(-)